jgi:uncharacterized protein YdhG (YjbR/CyaY superfamily)
MQYNVDSATQYLEAVDNDWRKTTLLELRSMILANPAKLQEGIQYKMLAYSIEGQTILHLNAQKNYVSLYVGDHRKIDPNLELLAGLNVGKGCVRFSKSVIVSETKIAAFISKAIQLATDGKDIGC